MKTATKKEDLRTRRVRFFPTPEQRLGLKSWFGAVRFCYNQLVARYRVVGLGGVSLKTLRSTIKEAEHAHPWLKEIHSEIKDVAVRDFDKARESHFAKYKGVKVKATFKFRSKKDPQQSFDVRARDMSRGSGDFFFIRFDSLKFGKNEKEKLPEVLEHTVRIICDRHNRYFLSIPYKAETKDTSTKTTHSVVALDPGVRTFQTTYDNLGYATEWGKGDMTQLFRLCLFADKLQSVWEKKKGSKRRSTKKAWLRALERIRNKRKEVHCKMTTWLCQEYKVILIPLFETSNMVKRGNRKIKSKTVRGMLTWSHYTFREMLKTKAQLYPGTKVVVCDEAYTSKTCGQCGHIHPTLGGSKIFKCKSCAYVGDRDISAARNILLRYLSL
jgi:putative transposase